MTGQHAPIEPEPFAPSSFAEHYQTSEHYAHFEQEHRRGGTFGLTIMDVKQEAGEFIDPAVPDLAFLCSVADAGSGHVNFGDGWRRTAMPREHSTFNRPAPSASLRSLPVTSVLLLLALKWSTNA